MLFNELIEKEGIESVASTTNISIDNLKFLVDENFVKLNRVRALGFLLILEREYKDVDVSEFREKIKTYYEDNTPEDDKVVMVAIDSVEGGFSFFKLFIILSILGGGFYLYNTGKLNSLIEQVEEKEDFFDDKKALENNISNENANKVVVRKPNNESVTIEIPVAPKEKNIALNDKNSSSVKDAKAVQAMLSTSKKEENQSVAEVVKEVSQAFLAKEGDAALATPKEPEASTEVLLVTTVNINPTRGMLWFGFINLETKKRREFMKKSSTPFNIADGRWLLVTGHGFLDIVANDKILEVADNKKHYFYIDSQELKEISKREFRELNGNRGW